MSTQLLEPIKESERVQSLDILRGFALLGILLLNIIEFGMISATYSNPGLDLRDGSTLDVGVWATVEVFAEGAMRSLFSMLFGAGTVLFATGLRAKSGWLYTKRTFWLLVIGLFDLFVLLWLGDILVTYALAGAILYWLRNLRVRWLLALVAFLLVAMSLLHLVMNFGLGQAAVAAQEVVQAPADVKVSEQTRALAAQWHDFEGDFSPDAESQAEELSARRDGYLSALRWNAPKAVEFLTFVIPVFILWDSLAGMILGMALFKLGVLQGHRSRKFYLWLCLVGFPLGIAINSYEVSNAIRSNFDIFSTFAQMQPTYHFGRLAMGMGYIGLVILFSKSSLWARLQRQLAATGRMALTNYLMHSVIALFLFTGVGLGLVGTMNRAALYPIVIAIWVFQLFASEWWLARYKFGPCEWLWRLLTYGHASKFRRD